MINKPFEEIEKVFKEDKARNAIVANYADLKRKDQPYLSLPGLKRFCDNHIKFRKVIIETDEDVMETKMWFRGNNEIPFTEIIKIQRKEPQERQTKEQMEAGMTWEARTGNFDSSGTVDVKFEEPQKVVSLNSLRQAKKKGMSDENKKAASDRMKKYHVMRKEAKNAGKTSK